MKNVRQKISKASYSGYGFPNKCVVSESIIGSFTTKSFESLSSRLERTLSAVVMFSAASIGDYIQNAEDFFQARFPLVNRFH